MDAELGGDLLGVDGLDEVGVGAERPAADEVALVGPAREHEHLRVGGEAALAARLEDVVAVDAAASCTSRTIAAGGLRGELRRGRRCRWWRSGR